MKQKAVFLDRDDTLIEDPGYISHPSQVKLLPGVSEALIELRKIGYLLVVTTNQSAIARGMVTEDGLAQIHHHLEMLLGNEGAHLDRIYYCPFHPNGVVPEYRKESDLRKPSPGMILKAAAEMEIDLERSWTVGNSYRDIEAGIRAGCKTILIRSAARPVAGTPSDPTPFQKAVNIKEAVNIIKMYDRQHHVAVESKEEPVRPTLTAEPSVQSSMTPARPAAAVAVASGALTETSEKRMTPTALPKAPPAEVKAVEEPAAQTDPLAVETAHAEVTHPHPAAGPGERSTPHAGNRTEALLEEILRQLRASRRESLFDEFSFWKFLSGVLQVVVIFCLLMSLYFLLGQTPPNMDAVHLSVQYAMVVQLMVVAFFLMRDRK
jgi:D,D-heptose 1,7-bisphosphate phosphatase